MSKIERRHTVVTLNQGNYEHELADLLNRVMAAQRAEDGAGPRRVSQKSEAMELAKQHDDLLAVAEASQVKVDVWAIAHTQWEEIADRHPPRDGDADDKSRGVNMKTFPPALLRASLVAPGQADDIDDLLAKGEAALVELGDLSRLHYVSLEREAWNVNVGDDALPKYSLVSQLARLNEPESRQRSDSE